MCVKNGRSGKIGSVMRRTNVEAYPHCSLATRKLGTKGTIYTGNVSFTYGSFITS